MLSLNNKHVVGFGVGSGSLLCRLGEFDLAGRNPVFHLLQFLVRVAVETGSRFLQLPSVAAVQHHGAGGSKVPTRKSSKR